jgi:hypothetical protein
LINLEWNVKKILIALAALLIVGSAQAQTSGANAQVTSAGTAAAQGGTAGVDYSPTSNVGGTEYKVNSAIAPGLVAGFNTCLGSIGAAVQTGPVGLAAGKTVADDPCNLRSNSGQIFQMGDHAAAFALLCQNDDNAYAINVTGGITYKRADGETVHRACPMPKAQWIAAGRPMLDPVTGQPYSDPPIVVSAAKADPNVAIIEQHAAKIAKSQDQIVSSK